MRHSHHPCFTDGVKQEVNGYKDSLEPDQIDALTAYVRSLGK